MNFGTSQRAESPDKNYPTPPHTDSAIEHLYLINGNEPEAERTIRRDYPNKVIKSIKRVYSPTLLASYQVRYFDKLRGIDKVESQWMASPEPDNLGVISWSQMRRIEPDKVSSTQPEGALFSKIPDSINTGKELENHRKRLADRVGGS